MNFKLFHLIYTYSPLQRSRKNEPIPRSEDANEAKNTSKIRLRFSLFIDNAYAINAHANVNPSVKAIINNVPYWEGSIGGE